MKRLNILHIACITNEFHKGACVATIQHIIAQSKIENVGFINTNNIEIEGVPRQFSYQKNTIETLPTPFDHPDFVVFHEVYRSSFLKIYKLLLKKAIPYIILPHGCLTNQSQKRKKIKKTIANKLLFEHFIKNAQLLHCLSENEARNSLFNIKKIVVGNGVNIPVRKKESFNETGLKFVFIGRIDIIVKGLDLLVDAIERTKEELLKNKIEVKIYGAIKDDDSKKLKHILCERKIENIVQVLDAVSGEEKERALLESDIFLLTSRTEGMPMGLLEAFSYGIPCLITEGTSMADVVQMNDMGWTSKTDSADLAKNILKVIAQRNLLKEKSLKAIDYAEENLSWNRVAEETIDEYRKAMLLF